MAACGSEFKYGIKIKPINGVHLEDCDFEVSTYVNPNRSVVFKKKDEVHIKKIDADTYKVVVDTYNSLKIGCGTVLAQLKIHIPDGDYQDGFRTEIYKDLCTGHTLK